MRCSAIHLYSGSNDSGQGQIYHGIFKIFSGASKSGRRAYGRTPPGKGIEKKKANKTDKESVDGKKDSQLKKPGQTPGKKREKADSDRATWASLPHAKE